MLELEEVILLGEVKNKIEQLKEIVNEAAYFANMAKNSTAVAVGENEILTRIFTGQLMIVDRRDISVSPHLIMSGEWEMDITQIFRHYIKENSVVFDVGANSGYYGIIAGSSINNGSIHFFEPNPNLIPLIKKSLWVNGLMGLSKINQQAVSNEDGKNVILNIVEDLWGSSSLHSIVSTVNIEDKVEVETITLDSYAERNKLNKIDVIKIDVEGHEEHVFQGMMNILSENPQLVIFMEYTIGAYSKEFFNLLKSKFKNIVAIKGNNITPIQTEKDLLRVSNEWVMLLLSNEG